MDATGQEDKVVDALIYACMHVYMHTCIHPNLNDAGQEDKVVEALREIRRQARGENAGRRIVGMVAPALRVRDGQDLLPVVERGNHFQRLWQLSGLPQGTEQEAVSRKNLPSMMMTRIAFKKKTVWLASPSHHFAIILVNVFELRHL